MYLWLQKYKTHWVWGEYNAQVRNVRKMMMSQSLFHHLSGYKCDSPCSFQYSNHLTDNFYRLNIKKNSTRFVFCCCFLWQKVAPQFSLWRNLLCQKFDKDRYFLKFGHPKMPPLFNRWTICPIGNCLNGFLGCRTWKNKINTFIL